jgi:regulator of protease activity HflC (stomatin/prohibitin superfamily)
MEWIDIALFGGLGVLVILLLMGIRVVRPTQRGLIERMGKYNRFADQGMRVTIPFVEKLIKVNITEQMVDAEEQQIITKDRLNAGVDAQVYFKVKPTEDQVKASQYNVNDYEYQIVNLARTTLRNIIGNMSYEDANSKRGTINKQLHEVLNDEAKPWGIEIVRTEIKQIDPPKDVQDSMNKVIMAENLKKAAVDNATAKETEADGFKRAAVKTAEGKKQALILEAEGQAGAIEKVAKADATRIQLVNTASEKYFKGNAQTLKKLEVTEAALKRGTKYVITDGKSNLVNVMSEAAGVTPVPTKGN